MQIIFGKIDTSLEQIYWKTKLLIKLLKKVKNIGDYYQWNEATDDTVCDW